MTQLGLRKWNLHGSPPKSAIHDSRNMPTAGFPSIELSLKAPWAFATSSGPKISGRQVSIKSHNGNENASLCITHNGSKAHTRPAMP